MRRTFTMRAALSLMAALLVGQALTSADDPEPVSETNRLCQELAVIEQSGESRVRQYLANLKYHADSRYDRFAFAISVQCPQYMDALRTTDSNTNTAGAQSNALCVNLRSEIAASFDLDKQGFRRLATRVYRDCRTLLPELAQLWQNTKARNASLDFDILHPCDQLRRKQELRQPIENWVSRSGVEHFANSILQYCPDYVVVLAAINDPLQTSIDFYNPEFERKSPCEKLAVIENDGKDLESYIRGSGVEDFELDVRLNCFQYQGVLDAAR
ncbi:MAG: hypothetical protein AAF773_28735 [Cyanobacteria bacterium P01_D01_bin.115]